MLPNVAELKAEGIGLLVQRDDAVASMQQRHAFLLTSAPALRVQDVPELLRLYKELVLQHTALSLAITHRQNTRTPLHMPHAAAQSPLGLSPAPDAPASTLFPDQRSLHHQQQQQPPVPEGIPEVLPGIAGHAARQPESPSGRAKQGPAGSKPRASPLGKAAAAARQPAVSAEQPEIDGVSGAGSTVEDAASESHAAERSSSHSDAGLPLGLDDLRPLQPDTLQPGLAASGAASAVGLEDLAASAQPISFTTEAPSHDAGMGGPRIPKSRHAPAAAPAADLISNPSEADEAGAADSMQRLPLSKKWGEAVLQPASPQSRQELAASERKAERDAPEDAEASATLISSEADMFSGLSMAAATPAIM